LSYAATTKGEAQRSIRTFYEVVTNGEGREDALKGVFDIFVDLRAQAIFRCNHLMQEDF